MTAPALPSRAIAPLESPEKLRPVQVILGGLLSVDLHIPGMEQLTILTVATGVAVAIGLLQRPRFAFKTLAWVPLILVALLVYLAAVSALTDQSPFAFNWQTRLLRISAVVVLALWLAVGRLHFRSILIGTLTALALNLPLFYLGIVPDFYGGVLTGYAGDKNTAGMVYAIAGLAALSAFRNTLGRILTLAIAGAAIWLTDSRTSITAFAMGLLWIYAIARRPTVVRWVAGVAVIWGVNYLEDNFALYARFASRAGSDHLRERIADAAAIKLNSAPWWGDGLGEAYVTIDQYQWLFHNAYSSL
ncbi:MAG: hypothetical protein ACK5LN_08615, partial [Propioniciclava sp.]